MVPVHSVMLVDSVSIQTIKNGKEFFIKIKLFFLLDYAKLARKQQENRGMSSNSSGILGSSSTRRLSNQSGNSFGKLTSSSSPPPVDDIILDRSPTG